MILIADSGSTKTDWVLHRAYYGYVSDNGEVLDEVILLVFKGPASFTGEDTIEIQCHGGILMMQKILDLCIRSRPADRRQGARRKDNLELP